MKPKITITRQADENVAAHLEGELTVKFASDVRQCLTQLTDMPQVTLTIAQPLALDVTVLQLVYALKKLRERNGLPTTLRANLSEGDHTFLSRIGFSSLLNLSSKD